MEYAVLEPNGDLSVIPKFDKGQPTRGDLGCISQPQEFPLLLVADGQFCRSNLKKAGIDPDTLLNQLKVQGAPDLSSIFLCYRDESGRLQTYLRSQLDLE